ncbi:hypothetical protein H9L39_20180 [Fusarium oxysporum f. sp. albedinis]|nr:hypothetical protein H9L39_20180 [Fusarium oxysporum f. sp. albedinis]
MAARPTLTTTTARRSTVTWPHGLQFLTRPRLLKIWQKTTRRLWGLYSADQSREGKLHGLQVPNWIMDLGTASSRSIANEHQGQEAANTAESAANTA